MTKPYDTYRPKGSMCMNCKHVQRDCSHLPFWVMPVLKNEGKSAIVRCTDFAAIASQKATSAKPVEATYDSLINSVKMPNTIHVRATNDY